MAANFTASITLISTDFNSISSISIYRMCEKGFMVALELT